MGQSNRGSGNWRKLVAVFATAAAITYSSAAGSALNEWERIHPDGPDNALGGPVASLAIGDGASAYIVSPFGYLYRQEDRDAPWQRVPVIVEDRAADLEILSIYAADTNVLAAATASGSVIRSVDGGDTWAEIFPPFSPVYRTALAVAPSDSDVIYFFVRPHGLYRTNDGGETWHAVGGDSAASVWEIHVDPQDPHSVYVLDDQRVKKSTDGGVTWELKDQGIDPSRWPISALTIDPNDGQTLYAGSGANNYLYKSTDGAEFWTGLDFPFTTYGENVDHIAVDPGDSNVVYVASPETTEGSVYRSRDGGQSWERLAGPDGIGAPYHLGVTPGAGVLAAGTAGVLHLTANDYFRFSNAGYSDVFVKAVATAPSDRTIWYMASQWNGVFAKSPGTDTWVERSPVDRRIDVRDLSIDGSDPLHVVAATVDGLFETLFAGVAWWEFDTPGLSFFEGVRVAASDSNFIYARSHGLWGSSDGGQTWTELLPSALLPPGWLLPIEVSPADPRTVFVGTANQGLYISSDAGGSWRQATTPFQNPRVSAVAIDRRDPNTVYAGLTDRYVWRSDDGGFSWTDITANLPVGSYVSSLAIDYAGRDVIYMTDSAPNVWVYQPDLNTWETLGEPRQNGCDPGICRVYADTGKSDQLVLATNGELFRYVFDSDLDGIADADDNCAAIANASQLDSDDDSIGNACDADLNGDCLVNFADLAILKMAFVAGPYNENADFDGDGAVNAADLAVMRASFFNSPTPGPGPSGVQNACD